MSHLICTNNHIVTHLGSANWITDGGGLPIQYIHYAPYGELIDNQHASWYDERYKFTGKERDWETGYDMFGARYLWSPLGWTSVDPLADKYPNISPYAYCNWNPMRYIDPDGRDVFTINEENGTIERVHTEGGTHSYYLTNGAETSYVGSFQQNENGLVGLSGNIAFNNTSGKTCSFTIKEGNESRSFISPNALASLIGAVGSLGYTDVSVVGFSLSDGSSPSPSISHRNGNVGDLRYLRTDGVSAPVLVKGNNFDIQRNEALTSALHKFGWKDMISERVGGYLLQNTSAASERGIRTNHTNHLHIQGYRPSILETYIGGNLPDIIVHGKRL